MNAGPDSTTRQSDPTGQKSDMTDGSKKRGYQRILFALRSPSLIQPVLLSSNNSKYFPREGSLTDLPKNAASITSPIGTEEI